VTKQKPPSKGAMLTMLTKSGSLFQNIIREWKAYLAMINYDVPMSKYREEELQVALFFLQMPIFTDQVGRTKSFIMHFKFKEFSVRSK
jgi:hypothetical protein